MRSGQSVSWAFREWLYKLKKGERYREVNTSVEENLVGQFSL